VRSQRGRANSAANLLLACDVVVDPRGRPQRRLMPHILTVEASNTATQSPASSRSNPTIRRSTTVRCGVPYTSGDNPEQPRPRTPEM
jgi:hypothetical protein